MSPRNKLDSLRHHEGKVVETREDFWVAADKQQRQYATTGEMRDGSRQLTTTKYQPGASFPDTLC